MYCGEVSLNHKELPLFLSSAEVLQVKGLSDNGNAKVQLRPIPHDHIPYEFDVDDNNKESIDAPLTKKNDRRAIVPQRRQKRAREQSISVQSTPKRVKIHGSSEAQRQNRETAVPIVLVNHLTS